MSEIRHTYITVLFPAENEKKTYRVDGDVLFEEQYFPKDIFHLYDEKITKLPFCSPHRHIKTIVNYSFLFTRHSIKSFFKYYEQYLTGELYYETFVEIVDNYKTISDMLERSF